MVQKTLLSVAVAAFSDTENFWLYRGEVQLQRPRNTKIYSFFFVLDDFFTPHFPNRKTAARKRASQPGKNMYRVLPEKKIIGI